jgi:hypothetical protein
VQVNLSQVLDSVLTLDAHKIDRKLCGSVGSVSIANCSSTPTEIIAPHRVEEGKKPGKKARLFVF